MIRPVTGALLFGMDLSLNLDVCIQIEFALSVWPWSIRFSSSSRVFCPNQEPMTTAHRLLNPTFPNSYLTRDSILYMIKNVVHSYTTLWQDDLSRSLMEEILWCYHSNETSFKELFAKYSLFLRSLQTFPCSRTIYLSNYSKFLILYIKSTVKAIYLEVIIFAKKLRRIINKEFLVQCLLICIAGTNMNDNCRYLFSLKEKEKRSFLTKYHINHTIYVYFLTRSFKIHMCK